MWPSLLLPGTRVRLLVPFLLLLMWGAGPAAAQVPAGPPLTASHWLYDFMEALDAGGAAYGWMTGPRPVAEGAVVAELERALANGFVPSAHEATIRAWLDHARHGLPGFESRAGLQLDAGSRRGQAFVDPGGGEYGAVQATVHGPGGLSVWGRWDSGSRDRFSGWSEGGFALPIGSFTLMAGRLPFKTAVPSPTSVQFSAGTPTDGVFLTSRRPSSTPGLTWLLGPAVWQFAVAPWAGFAETETGWVGSGSAIFQPHPRLRVGAARSVRFGGEGNAATTPERLLRALLFRKNEPTGWDDHKLELSARLRWALFGQPLATHLVLAQEDSPLWKDPAIAVGMGTPIFLGAGLVQLGYDYTAYGQRARWCPGCGYATGRQEHRFQGEWYFHGQHGSHERRGVPVGNALGGYGASHAATARFWGADGRTRGESRLFFERREHLNMLMGRWPGKRRGIQLEIARGVGSGWEIAATGLLASGPDLPTERGLWLRASWTPDGWGKRPW